MSEGQAFELSRRRRFAGTLAAIVLAFALCETALAQIARDKPPVPKGVDPGGIAIALIATGIDYTHPDIKDRLARDGEGEVIGFDLVDNDHRPYAATNLPDNHEGAVDTLLARRILSTYRHARLVPVRVNPNDKVMLARALAFTAATPAKIVAVPLWGEARETWEFFGQAAEQVPDHLIILPAGDADAVAQGRQQFPAALNLKSALIVAAANETMERGTLARPGAPRIDALMLGRGGSWFPGIVPTAADATEAVALAAGLAACAQHGKPPIAARELREQLLALAVRKEGPRETPVLDPLCLYGGTRY
jgi:subtilisin family serine protease